jgi:hypothetical protein
VRAGESNVLRADVFVMNDVGSGLESMHCIRWQLVATASELSLTNSLQNVQAILGMERRL